MQVDIKYTESMTTLAIFFVFSTALTLLLNRRKSSRSHQLASLAHGAMLLGAWPIYLRDQLPEQWVFILCNLAFQASLFSSWLSMMYFHQLQHSHRYLRYLAWGVWLAGFAVMMFYPQILFQYRFRMLVALPLYLFLFGMMAWISRRIHSDHRPLSQSICLYLGLIGFTVTLLRLINALHIHTPFPAAQDISLQSILMTVMAICMFSLALALVFWQYENGAQQLQRLADLDGLTGVPNRRSFVELASKLLQRQPVYSLLVIDIDHFKQVNDQHGHLAGDQVLRQLGEQLRLLARQDDLLCRYGGEEFCLLLPETRAAQALALAERLRLQVSQQIFYAGNDLQLAITLSIGVSSSPRAQQPLALDAMFALADEALYLAKRQGRNQVVAAAEPVLEPVLVPSNLHR
ncbi:GGDEF domain-containing protein [Aquitalea pelogenes]|uniref:GGDEF domain-containing protein n=1 Tax=Aquitalea pelogenes TaxID=1293573 RepID=UPI0035AF0E51